MILLLSFLACTSEYYEFTGSVAGTSFTPVTGYFGGEYIIFFNEPIECKEMHWITKIYRNGDAPYDTSLKAVQISYNESNVVNGTYPVGGDASLTTQFLNIEGDSFSVVKATEGTVIISDTIEQSFVEGNFNVGFGADPLEGSFSVPWCTNLVR